MKRLVAEGKLNKSNQIAVSVQNLINCSMEKFGKLIRSFKKY